MANIHDCLRRAVADGTMSEERAEAALDYFDQLVARYQTELPPAQARARATADLRAATKQKTAALKHKTLNQLQAITRIKHLVETSADPAVAVRNLMEASPGSGFKGESVRYLAEAYKSQIAARMADVLEKTGINLIGESRDKSLLTDLLREAFGETTGSPTARHLAKTLQETQHWLVRELNAHGADVKLLKNYGVPQSHDAGLMQRAGFDAWARFIETRLDWSRIDNFDTGRPFADQAGLVPPRSETERFLREVFDSITTRGWNDREPGLTLGGKALYNQRQEHRVLHFKSADTFMEYSREFGGSDPFSAMMNGLSGMADDIAEMRVLGPNPKAGLIYAEQVLRSFDAQKKNPKLTAKIEYNTAVAHAMLAHQNGTASIPIRQGWAAFFGGVRSWITSSYLGSAILSSVSDQATMAVAAQAVGMGQARTLTDTLKLITSSSTRQSAKRMGYMQMALMDAAHGYVRFTGPQAVRGIGSRLAGFTLRATGLTFVTDMRKLSFQMGFSAHLADNADLAFDQIDPMLRKVFKERGITPADWDALRAPEGRFIAEDGADFISPFYWAKTQKKMPADQANALSLRMQMVMQEYLERAIPAMSLEGRAITQSGAPGSVLGEATRSASMFKSFGLSVMLNQFRTFMAEPTPLMGAVLFAKISAYLTLAGAISIQLRELGKGNDPRPMTDLKFWAAAYMQGGGLGIIGDFLFSETNRNGDGIAGVAVGPVIGLGGDILGIATKNAQAALTGKDTSVASDALGLFGRTTPYLSSAPAVRVAYGRLALDELQKFIDPRAAAKQRQRERKMLKDFGNAPFATSDDFRLPDLTNIAGD